MKEEQNLNNQEAASKQLSLEEAFGRLEEIAAKLEEPQTPLEESFLLYREGVMLLKSCADRLDLVEKKMLVLNEEGDLREFPG